METPNFQTSTYRSAAIISPLLAATKHDGLVPQQRSKNQLKEGGKTRGEQRNSVRKCHGETLSHVQVGPALKERTCSGQRPHPVSFAANGRLGRTTSLRFNSEGRTPALRVWKQLKANSEH